MFTSILVPIDVAHESSWRHALPEALALARDGQGGVTALAVVPDVTTMFIGVQLAFQLQEILDQTRSRLNAIVDGIAGGGGAIAREVRFGTIGGEILRAAGDRACDLIVMESHRPEMKDYLIGPNAAHVARHARCSVLVLRKAAGPAG
jgi:nucleotide-binding universal stress UspA family protein